ncbi:MAG: protein kinase domain-containing protein, partial [Chloroflexota bacterium]
MENLVGQTLNRYQIKSLLGEGGMGAVYRAYDTTLQRDVAIKVMHPHFARQPNFQERFLQEARTAARLSHPGIVQIHDFGSYHAQLYIVMKFIPGDNLEEMLRQLRARDRWIPLGEAVQLVRQAALALNYAHRQGVLHRDIKPGNIMLEPEPADGLPYRPVVTDLGLAKLVQGGMMTQDGQSMGTPAYMSPEQAQGAPTDARSDVYSLGILLYELATGRLPFNPRTLTEAIQMHVHTPPATPRSLRAEITEALERVILQAIQKDPARRFQNAQALADALAQVYPSTSGVNAPPRGVGATLSLMTQWQNSLAEPRGPSVFEDTSAGYAADPSGRDRIEILAGDQTTHTVAFRPPAMTIGRDPDSDLFVDDPKVSRQHARVEFDGQSFRVTDLNSTNGSFLDGRRLHGGVPQAWHPGQTLSVGAAHLRLLRPGMPPGGETAPAAGATLRGDSPYLAYPSGGTTRAAAGPAPVFGFDSRMEPPHLAAGEIGRVTIHNGGAADRFSIHWLSPGDELDFTPPNLQVDVAAGQELVAEFRAEPRRSAWIGGGRSYPFSAQVSPGSGVPQMHHGELSARAALPGWAIPLLLVLCLALVGGLLLLSDMVFGSSAGLTLGNASATDAFARTQVALAVEGTRAAGSATALAIQGANHATQQAAEQTLQAQAALSSATAAAAATAQAATVTAMQPGAQTALALTSTAQVATLQAGVSGTAAAQATAQAAPQAA